MNLFTLRRSLPILALCAATLPLTPAAAADAVDKALSRSEDNIHREQRTQKHIDKLSEETQALLAEYQALSRELDGLTV